MAEDRFSKLGVPPPPKGQADTSLFDKIGVPPPPRRDMLPATDSPTLLQQMGAGLWRGMAKTAAGPVQFTLDALAPEAGQAFTEYMNEVFQRSEAQFGRAPVSELAGSVLPLLAIPGPQAATIAGRVGSAAGIGAVVGSAGFSSDYNPDIREKERLQGAGIGTVLGAAAQTAVEAVSHGVAKAANTRALQKKIAELAEDVHAAEKGPMLKRLQSQLERAVTKLDRSKQKVIQYGNQLGGRPSNLYEKIGPLMDSIDNTRSGLELKEMLSDMMMKTAPARFQSGPIADAPLSVQLKQMQKFMGRMSPEQMRLMGIDPQIPSLKYSDYKSMSDSLDLFLKDRPTLSRATRRVAEAAKQQVDDILNQFHRQSPDLGQMVRKLEVETSKFEEMLKGPLGPIVTAPPDRRLELTAKAYISAKPKEQKIIDKVIGAKGKEALTYEWMDQALSAATNPKTGFVDPVKFQSWFRENNVEKFLGPQQNAVVKGIRNLLEEHALRAKDALAAANKRNPRFTNTMLTAAALYHTLRGNLRGLAASIGAKWLTHGISGTVQNALVQKYGINYLIAAGKMTPGSPRMAQLFDRLMRDATMLQTNVAASMPTD